MPSSTIGTFYRKDGENAVRNAGLLSLILVESGIARQVMRP